MTIDGPAGAGKSTVARALATRLGFRALDTGAMYRAVALEALETGRPAAEVAAAGAWRVHLSDPRIRSEAVDEAVGAVAADPAVREALHVHQRAFLAEGDAVAEGRDIGNVVWPEAELKVWLDADPALRVRRRAAEGGEERGALALERDRRDAAQSVPAPDAVVVWTDDLDVDGVVAAIVTLVEERRHG